MRRVGGRFKLWQRRWQTGWWGGDLERELLRGLVRDVQAGQAAVLLIEDEVGIGKSRLVQSLIAEAHAAGAVVFCGEAHPFERAHPFGAVADALDLRRRSPDPRPAMIGSLLVGDAERPPAAGGAPDLRYQIVEETLDLLEASCADGPVILVLRTSIGRTTRHNAGVPVDGASAIPGVCHRRTESNGEPLTCEENLTGLRYVGGRLNTLAPISGSRGHVPNLRLALPDGAVLSLVPVIIRP